MLVVIAAGVVYDISGVVDDTGSVDAVVDDIAGVVNDIDGVIDLDDLVLTVRWFRKRGLSMRVLGATIHR